MVQLLDAFFAAFHGALILFNLTGWIWARTRRVHLVVIGLTFLSWFGLGVFYGWGYCPCTDWHWQVKRALGETDLPYSYVKYYVDWLTRSEWDPLMVDAAVLALGLLALILSLWTNWMDAHGHRTDLGEDPSRRLRGRPVTKKPTSLG
jgi:hypothetical protein